MPPRECSNKRKCPCSWNDCERHGKCCECLAYHLKSDQLPGCCFPPEVEKTGDRSINRFIKTRQG